MKSKMLISDIRIYNLVISLLIIASFLSHSFCSIPKEATIAPDRLAEFHIKTDKADSLFRIGSYVCLKEAFNLYQELLSYLTFQEEIKEKLLKAALLLAQRENELVILGDKYLKEASNLIQNNSYLSEFSKYLEIVQVASREFKRYYANYFEDDSNNDSYFNWIRNSLKPLGTQLKALSESEDFNAYFYISLRSKYSRLIGEKDDLSRFLRIFPHSSLILFKLALSPKINKKALEELIQEVPRFHEALYYIGEKSLHAGKIITAEKNFLKAYEHIPQSISITISLTKIYFVHEEFERCLEFNEKALHLAPEYREALLGKAVCLSLLGRYEEAIECLNKLIQKGMYLLGESYYWLSWNQNGLRRYEEAWENIENSKKYLIGHHEVFSLAGSIALERGDIEVAKENFLEALKLNSSNCEASFCLGKIYAKKEEWINMGSYYERAALCNSVFIETLKRKIREIENSSLSNERKEKQILRKESQLKKRQLIKATSFYNAAAGFFNGEMREKALSLAHKATSHSVFKEKAEQLIQRIKELN